MPTVSAQSAASTLLQASPRPAWQRSTHFFKTHRPPNDSLHGTQRSYVKPPKAPKTALFFPGQGVQRTGMTTAWLNAFPRTCRAHLDLTDSILQLPTPLSSLIRDGPSSLLTATENAQPAIMATSVMILRVLEHDFAFRLADHIDITLGHSLGEFAALVAGGYLDYGTALRICRTRGEAMARCTREAAARDPGAEYGMVALVCEPDGLAALVATIDEFLGQKGTVEGWHGGQGELRVEGPAIKAVQLANVNSRNQIVLSGDLAQIKELLVQLRQFGGHDPRAVRLKADSPFHSPVMRPAKRVMHGLLQEADVKWPGLFPCVSNVSARPFEGLENLRDLLARQCVETVRWWEGIRWVDRVFGARRWVGIGPGVVGRNLVGKEVGMRGREGDGGVWGVGGPGDVEILLRGLEETEGG
ncbi:hypothetical protein MMC13_005319 [Lambiella insularis]|nr:hypothetical protein [Lambiella insularis]